MLSRNQRSRRAWIAGLFLCFGLGGLVASATADPVTTQGGTVVLALSGLEVDLPMLPDTNAYRISGSFALDEEGNYDGRDVIDEFSGEDLVAGTWISLGYFSAGTPDAVVAGAGITDGWNASFDLWGATWSLAGGIFTFETELGAKPAIVACTEVGNGKAILIHRFFLDQPTTMSQADMLALFEQAPSPRAAWASYSQQRTGVVVPLHRPEVRSRGAKEAARWEYFETSLIEVEIPDDGYVWLLRAAPDQGVDFLDRMAPALPEVTIEVLTLPGQTCDALFASIPLEKRDVVPQNLPDGWNAGPQLVVDNELELTTCHQNDAGITVIGVFQGPTNTDIGYLGPLFAAIKAAVEVE